MDKCKTVQDLLADYRTGILADKKRRMVEAHLAECPACAEELRVLDDVLALVSNNTPESEPPAGLWNGVANRIASQAPSRRPILGTLKPLRVAGAGVAALALALGLWLGGPHNDSIAPVNVAANNEYVQGHALYAGQAPLADRVSYLSVVASNDTQSK